MIPRRYCGRESCCQCRFVSRFVSPLASCWLSGFLFLWVAIGSSPCASGDDSAPPFQKIVLLAGPDDPEPLGESAGSSAELLETLQDLLENSALASRLRCEVHPGGWPRDEETLEDADAIIVLFRGVRSGSTDHPLTLKKRWDVIRRHVERGGGLMLLGDAVDVPVDVRGELERWMGATLVEAHSTPPGRSPGKKRTISAVLPGDESHPITFGWSSFALTAEVGVSLAIGDSKETSVPVLRGVLPGTVPAKNGEERPGDDRKESLELPDAESQGSESQGSESPDSESPETVPQDGERQESESRDEPPVEDVIGWSWQHPSGSRGFACSLRISPEHFASSEFRRVLLGGMAWTAGQSIPPTGLDVEQGKPIHALIVTDIRQAQESRQESRQETWRETQRESTEFLQRLLLQDVRMDVEVVPDPEFLRSPQILDYDVVLLNDPDEQILEGLSDLGRENLLRFLSEGGGLVGNHPSSESFIAWFQGDDKSPATRQITPPVAEMETGDRTITWGRYRHGRLVRMALEPPAEAISAEEIDEKEKWEGEESIRRGTAWAAGRIPRLPPLSRELFDSIWNLEPNIEESLSVLDGDHFEGFQEDQVVDTRFSDMDTGPFLSATVATPGGETWKGLVVRVGDQRQVSLCFDTELLRMSGAWDGFLQISPARFGLIQIPSPASPPFVQTPRRPGWSHEGSFDDPRPHAPHGTLPREWGRYRGLHLHGERVVIQYEVDGVMVWETPWWDEPEGEGLLTRTLQVGPSRRKLEMMVATEDSLATLIRSDESFSLRHRAGEGTFLEVSPAETARSVTLVIPRNRQLSLDRLEKLAGQIDSGLEIEQLTRPGPRRWPHVLETQGERGGDEAPYVLDTLTMPYDNPYGALMFASGHDFFSNGDAAVCTVHGDVWRVSGITDDLGELRWQRFATGLFQPLSLLVIEDRVHVVGRDQITILHDRNGDGEADYYQNFNNDGHVTANGHEYVACLERDSEGWFYFLKGDSNGATAHDGCLLRVSPDGETLEVFATGIRNGNGLGIGPGDVITLSPQEGNWTPASAIFEVQQGGFYGAMPSHHRETAPETMDPPLCWIPRSIDNSSGGQTWVTSDRWGPLKGALLHFSFGRCRMMVVLRDTVNGQPQGGVSPLPLQFLSGSMRGRFRDHDGQLYVTGLMGWVTSAVREGCFQRVRYTGRPAHLPRELQVHENGILIRFTDPLDRSSAEDIDNYTIQQWQYRWSGEYGSPEFRPSDERRRGRDPVPIRSATLLEDGKSLFLEIADLRPVMQMSLQYALRSPEGSVVRSSIDHTIHQLRPPFSKPERRVTELSKADRDSVPETTPPLLEQPRQGIWLEYFQPPVALPLSQVDRGRNLSRDTEVGGNVSSKRDGDSDLPSPEENEVSARHAQSSRLAAWDVVSGEPATSQLSPGPFSIRATGWIQSPLRGRYRFRLEGSGAAELFVNGFRILDVDEGRGRPRLGEETEYANLENGEDNVQDSASWGLFRMDGRASIPIQLNSGWNRIELRYSSRSTGEGRLRLLWSKEGVDGFAEEPVPPDALAHTIQDGKESRAAETRMALDLGRELYGKAGCIRCHDDALPEEHGLSWQPFHNQGPDLSGAGDRFESAWLHQWLLDPTSLRNDVWMPKLLKPGEEGIQQAADLVAYLGTLREPPENARNSGLDKRSQTTRLDHEKAPELPPHEEDDGLPEDHATPSELDEADLRWETGLLLYERRGCIACHHFEPPDEADPYQRVSLHYIGSKQSHQQLVRFLRQPHQFREVGARMPDFQLDKPEAEALAWYLGKRSTETSTRRLAERTAEKSAEKSAEGDLPEGDPLRGGRLFLELGCVQCHTIQQLDLQAKGPQQAGVVGGAAVAERNRQGCLSLEAEPTNRIARYDWPENERKALLEFLQADRLSPARESAREHATSAIRWLRCTACHDLDSTLAGWPEILMDEGELGHFPEQIPALTWSGEKLRGEWTERLLTGTLPYRARPWLEARMPVFPGHAKGLSIGLAALHGISRSEEAAEASPEDSSPEEARPGDEIPAKQSSAEMEPDRLAVARQLLSPAGLDCRQCHAPSDQVLRNENLAQGIGLGYMHQRLRPDFYDRWMRDPLRIDPATKMPRFSLDGRTTQAKHLLRGDAQRQFQLIWEYLDSAELKREAAGRGN